MRNGVLVAAGVINRGVLVDVDGAVEPFDQPLDLVPDVTADPA